MKLILSSSVNLLCFILLKFSYGGGIIFKNWKTTRSRKLSESFTFFKVLEQHHSLCLFIIFLLFSFHLRGFLPWLCLLDHMTCHDATSSSDTDVTEQRRKSGSRPSKDKNSDGVGVSATEKRFAYSLLEKLLGYFDNASTNLMETRPSSRFSRRGSYSTASEDVKFFAKVIHLI